MSHEKWLADFVSESLMISAGFNYFEPSTTVYKNGSSARVYANHYRSPLMIIIENRRGPENNRHTSWYFGQFPDYVQEADTSEHIFVSKVYETFTRKHRVAGRSLSQLIQDAI